LPASSFDQSEVMTRTSTHQRIDKMAAQDLIYPAGFNRPAVLAPGVAVPLRSYADVVERLFVEFEGRRSLPVIRAMVHECRAELSCSPETAMPELLERLARQRLSPAPVAVLA